ncbi:DUF5658 family protein [Bacillus sp. FJAT-29790]|uniref:DUF5658 family protein n=1 Tax=Bacillus sp. FJAT-29790 TaxID=1895002 RepID=UPI00349F1254
MELDLKKIIYFLAFLNIFDGVVTYVGLRYSLIEEGNPLMSLLYNSNSEIFIGYKLFLSLLLCALLLLKKIPTKGLVKNLAFSASILYMIVCAYHGFWILFFL